MNEKRIFVFGANGMLGNYVVRHLKREGYNVWPLTREDFNLKDIYEVEDFLHFCEIDEEEVIINCAGIIDQRILKRPKAEYILVNSLFPHLLASVSAQVIHITTDCVWNGYLGGYLETDIPDCTTTYGQSKSLGENDNNMNIRTSIIGESKNKRGLLEWAKNTSSQRIVGYTNHWWNGVTCHELAKVIERCIRTKDYFKGVRHLHSPEPINKSELLKMMIEVYEWEIEVDPTQVEGVDRTLSTLYGFCDRQGVPKIKDQLIELREVGYE